MNPPDRLICPWDEEFCGLHLNNKREARKQRLVSDGTGIRQELAQIKLRSVQGQVNALRRLQTHRHGKAETTRTD